MRNFFTKGLTVIQYIWPRIGLLGGIILFALALILDGCGAETISWYCFLAGLAVCFGLAALIMVFCCFAALYLVVDLIASCFKSNVSCSVASL